LNADNRWWPSRRAVISIGSHVPDLPFSQLNVCLRPLQNLVRNTTRLPVVGRSWSWTPKLLNVVMIEKAGKWTDQI
jgi:hypothetical protein